MSDAAHELYDDKMGPKDGPNHARIDALREEEQRELAKEERDGEKWREQYDGAHTGDPEYDKKKQRELADTQAEQDKQKEIKKAASAIKTAGLYGHAFPLDKFNAAAAGDRKLKKITKAFEESLATYEVDKAKNGLDARTAFAKDSPVQIDPSDPPAVARAREILRAKHDYLVEKLANGAEDALQRGIARGFTAEQLTR